MLLDELLSRAEHDRRRPSVVPASRAQRQAEGRPEHVDCPDLQAWTGKAAALAPEAQRAAIGVVRVPHLCSLAGGRRDQRTSPVVRSPASPTREYARTVSTGIERSRSILTASRRYYQARSVLKIDSVADPRLLPTGEAARAVGVSPRTLQRWVREGLVKPTQLTAGGHHRWDVEDLRAQIRALNEPSESD
jgi:hypothetical protein